MGRLRRAHSHATRDAREGHREPALGSRIHSSVALPPDDWPRLKDVFAGARALPTDERPAYLAAACDGNEALRQEVESLLSSDERMKSFLEAPAVVRGDDTRVTRSLEGQRIGPYQLASRIGAGGMGEVYQARDTTLDRQVAIKVLLPAVASDPDRLARFRREARVLASLNHPHIAQIHGFEDAGGVHALVMELVEGPTLADRIVSGAIPINEALAIASQIADALEAAHEQGIIHRDLKPANIKVREDGTVKVLDFGLAKGLDVPSSAGDVMQSPTLSAHATEIGLILGTAAYMSPEQARGKAVDRRADLWAFGCVLYEMLTRQRAFGGDNPTDVLAAVVTTEPEWTRLPAETPAAIRTLLRRCLEKNRARRLDSAVAARLEIDDALATPAAQTVVDSERIQSPGTAAPPSDRASLRRRQRQWTMIAGVAAVAVLVAAGGVWRLWQQDYFWQNPLADATVERLTDFEGEEADAAISPDGKFMTFLSDRDGPFDAWISQIGSGEFVNITKGRFQLMNNPNTRSAGFSGDGAQVWFMQQVSSATSEMDLMDLSRPGRRSAYLCGRRVGAHLVARWKERRLSHQRPRRSHLYRGPERQQSQTDLRGTAGCAWPLSDVVARRSLHLFREGHPPDRRNGYLAHPRVPERSRRGAGANHLSQCAGGVPRLARCANADLLGHG